MQLQLIHGDFDEKLHKIGFVDDLKAILPAPFWKKRDIEASILREYSLQKGITADQAKTRYVSLQSALDVLFLCSFFLQSVR